MMAFPSQSVKEEYRIQEDRTKDNFCEDMAGLLSMVQAILITVNADNLDNPKNVTSWREKKLLERRQCHVLFY